MPAEAAKKVEWFADTYVCDECQVHERVVYKALGDAMPVPEDVPDWTHDWRVIDRLAYRREPLAIPLAFCGRECMTAYMTRAVDKAYMPSDFKVPG